MPIGVRPTVDFAFKKIFGSPENAGSLIALLNAILEPSTPITDVDILNPFNYQEFAGDKLIVLDVKARDTTDRWFNVEMQVSLSGGLLSRLTYYACSLFVDQLESGEDYVRLRPAISICLLNQTLFADSNRPHHRFRLLDEDSGRSMPIGIEVHTLELLKYNLLEASISTGSSIEQWAFFLLFADQFDSEVLRQLLPAVEFQQAISVIETIAAKTEDRIMYDQREKAQRDYRWAISGALEEGREKGREQGHEQGHEEGREEGVTEGVSIGVTVGAIQTLQRFLNDSVSSTDALVSQDAETLASTLQSLQDRLGKRNS